MSGREWHHHSMHSQVARDEQTLAIGSVLAMGPSSAARSAAAVAVAA
jgi:hypothetical protein